MTKQIIPFTNESEWLATRVADITSTQCAALFNASPYLTAFELYHAKKSGEVVQRTDNPRMRWGRRLQNPIAEGVADDLRIHVRPMSEYIRDPDARIGSSFDFAIDGAHGDGTPTPIQLRIATHGTGLMEVKTVDAFEFKSNWLIVDGDVIEAPPHIELQVQHQMLVSGMQWALIVALVGGNRVSVIERAYDETICAAIMQKAREFWELVDRGTPPSPDYTRDAERIASVYLQATAGKLLDASDDATLTQWVREYATLGDGVRTLIRDRDTMRARILERIADAANVKLGDGVSMAASTVRETVVPQHTRKAYRALRVFTRKETA